MKTDYGHWPDATEGLQRRIEGAGWIAAFVVMVFAAGFVTAAYGLPVWRLIQAGDATAASACAPVPHVIDRPKAPPPTRLAEK
ncbi:MAG: hypothetical protein RJQ08_13475 [Salinisphaeraceae bacterium]